MQTAILTDILATPEGQEADAILRACVHCGFCTATCPTYQLLGDELDGPRGRIYQIKQVLEGHQPTRITQLHLDRCLTCRSCETTCPSGVRYGRPAAPWSSARSSALSASARCVACSSRWSPGVG
jgi:glycolate oxidase iron-sulfur subunit